MAAVGLTSAEQPLEVQQLQKPKEASGAGRPTATSRALGERAAGCDKNKQQPRRRDGGGTSEARGAADDDKDDKEDGRREPRLTQAEHGEHCEMGAQVERQPIGGGGGEGAARAAEFKLPATSQHFATTAESGAGGAHMTTTSADEPRRRAPQRKASVFSFDGFPSLDELDQAALKQHARQLSSSTGDLAAGSARLAPSKSASDQELELELEQDQEREQDDQMIAVAAAARREQEAGGEREQERQQVMIETAGKTAGGGGGGGETALGAAKSAASPRRSTRSDTLGSTGSSRASSCDEPTIVARGAKPLAKPLSHLGQRAGCEGPKGAPALDGLPRAIESSTSSLDSIASEKAPAAAVVAAVAAPSEPPSLPVTVAQSAPAEEAPVPMEVVEQEPGEDEGEDEDEESMEDEGLEAPSLGGNKRQPASRRRRRRLSSVSSNGSNSSADDVFESTTTGGGGGAEATCEAKLGALASRASNLPPPFESILSKLKRDSIPDANAIRQHIDKLISQNEAIIENWSQVSIRSYNSTAAGATATTTTSTSTSTPSGSSNAGSSLASPKSLKSAAGGADLKTPPALTQAAPPLQPQQLQQPQPPPRQRPSKQRWSTTALCQGNVFSQRQQLEELRLQHSRNQLASLAAPTSGADSLKATRDSLSQFVGARLMKRSYNLGVACAAAAAQATNNPAGQNNNNNNNNNNGNQINQNSQNQDQNSVGGGGGGDAGGASGAAHAPLQARRAPVRQTSDVSGLHPMLLTQAASSALFGAQPAELLAAGRHSLEQPQQFAFGLQQADLQPQQQQPQQNRLPASLASSPKPMVPANTFADVQNFLSSRFSLEAPRPAGELPPTCHFNQPPAAPVDNHLALKFKPDEPQGLLPMAGRAPSAFVVQRTDELRAMASLLAAQQRQQQLLEEQLCQQQQQRRRHQETAAGGDIPAALLDYYKLQLQQQALEHQANLSRLAALEAEFQQQQQLNARLLATTIQQQQQQQQQLPVALMQQPLECLGERQKRESQLLNEFLAKMILSRGAGDERRASTSGGGGGADEALASLDQRVAPIVRHSCDEEEAEVGEEGDRQRRRRPSEMFTQPLDSATPAHRCDACDISFWTRDLLNYHLMTSCSARTGPEPARPLAFNFAQPNGFDQLTAAAAAASSSLAMSPMNGLDMTSGRQHNGLAAGAFQLPPAAHSKSASPPPRRRTYHEMEAPSQALLQIPAKHQTQALLLGAAAAADDEQQRRFARSPLALDKQALVAPKSPHKSRKSAELAWQQRLDELCLLKQQLLTAGGTGAGAAAAATAELHPRQASSSGSAAGELQASSLPIKKRKISEPNMRY